jgi:outer membrane protein
MKRLIIGTILTALFGGAMHGALLAAQGAPARGGAPPPAPAPAAPQTAKPTVPTPQASTAKPPAAPLPFPTDAKIGFVNLQRVVSESQLGKVGQEKVQALLTKQNAEKTAKNAEIQKLQQEIQAGASVLTATVLQQKNADLDRLTRQAQFEEQQRQVDFNALQGQLLDDFGEKVMPIIEQIRAEKNLWMILTPTGDGSGVAAVNPALDLSGEVIKRLDAAK